MQLPKKWLIHSIKYKQYQGTNDWDAPIYDDPKIIDYVRFDDAAVFSRDSNQNKIIAEAVIFVDAQHSVPQVEFTEQSKITFNNKGYVLKKVIPCYYPAENKVHHWELEVV